MAAKVPNSKLSLVSDPAARSKAVVQEGPSIEPGEVIVAVAALVTSLLPRWKEKRCDWCCRLRSVKACSRCREVFYCSSDCQKRAWDAHHRRICGLFSAGFHLSPSFASETAEQQANADLLLNLWARMKKDNLTSSQTSSEHGIVHGFLSEPTPCFWSLLSHPTPRTPPPLPSSLSGEDVDVMKSSWSRFDCNNFVVHNLSTMQAESGSYALGIFPLASRCFNHSCAPNAWCSYRLRDGEVWLEVRSLTAIKVGEEVTIPYLDPALPYSERQLRLKQIYNFTCTCPRCTSESMLPEPLPSHIHSLLDAELCTLVFGTSANNFSPRTVEISRLPKQMNSVRHEKYFKDLSTRFENQTHDGPYDEAWLTGRALLALCLLVYPRHYPLTGYYALELVKACWNAHTLAQDVEKEALWMERARKGFSFAKETLDIAGGEEENEELAELTTLETLLAASRP